MTLIFKVKSQKPKESAQCLAFNGEQEPGTKKPGTFQINFGLINL
jgi:hypothetical protein